MGFSLQFSWREIVIDQLQNQRDRVIMNVTSICCEIYVT
jgi:hypothetical protein